MSSEHFERSCDKFKSCIYSFNESLNPYTESIQFKHFKKLGLNQISPDNNNFLVPLPLTKDVCYIENTVPSFKSIYEGNWEIIERFTKNLASQQNIEVLTGQFGHLKLSNTSGTLIDVNLEFHPDVTHYGHEEKLKSIKRLPCLLKRKKPKIFMEVGGVTFREPRRRFIRKHKKACKPKKVVMKKIKVPAFIYKIVKNKVNKEGLVFVSTNNPFLTNLTEIKELCSRSLCKDFSGFLETKKGYTYCCPVHKFVKNLHRIYKIKLKGGIQDAAIPMDVNEFLMSLKSLVT